ncbi:MAG: hypothetical protein U5L08_14465 [Xanthomonadales bacterium]|nr:hypothetical protein [Xanthomonadales bacterium]
MSQRPRLADVCAVALAECFRGDGEILANPIGALPSIGARLARETFEPDLCCTDGGARFVTGRSPFADHDPGRATEYWNPYRSMFDWVWSGRRHVVMGASQIDAHGNQNLAAIGNPAQPKVQLLGYRGSPGNTINDTTSYWIPAHSPRIFVDHVDTVCGVGTDRARGLGTAARFHHLRRVVTNLAVLDFESADGRMRLRSVHPGVSEADVISATGFELVRTDVVETRTPTEEETHLLEDVIDPNGVRHHELPDQ